MKNLQTALFVAAVVLCIEAQSAQVDARELTPQGAISERVTYFIPGVSYGPTAQPAVGGSCYKVPGSPGYQCGYTPRSVVPNYPVQTPSAYGWPTSRSSQYGRYNMTYPMTYPMPSSSYRSNYGSYGRTYPVYQLPAYSRPQQQGYPSRIAPGSVYPQTYPSPYLPSSALPQPMPVTHTSPERAAPVVAPRSPVSDSESPFYQ